MSTGEQRPFYTTGQVSEMTGLTQPQVVEAVHAAMIRTLPEEKRGGQYVLDARSVEEFIGRAEEWEDLLAEAGGTARPAA